jgi:hypothetical protein
MNKSVSKVIGYELDDYGSILSTDRDIFFTIICRPAVGPIRSPIEFVPGVLSTGVNRLRSGDDRLVLLAPR